MMLKAMKAMRMPRSRQRVSNEMPRGTKKSEGRSSVSLRSATKRGQEEARTVSLRVGAELAVGRRVLRGRGDVAAGGVQRGREHPPEVREEEGEVLPSDRDV